MVFTSFEAVFYSAVFLLPGYIIKNVLDRLLPPPKYSDAKYFMVCFFFSTLNFVIFGWAYSLVRARVFICSLWYWILPSFISLGGAFILALLIGRIRQKGWMQTLLSELNPNYPYPTAWDYWFSKSEPFWVIVTLTNGDKIYGKYGRESYAASYVSGHDLYLESIYSIETMKNSNLKWNEVAGDKGILILGDTIKCIEFREDGCGENYEN